MSESASTSVDSLGFDPASLSKSVLNAMRAGLGVIGLAAVVLGAVLVANPAGTAKFLVTVAGIYFVISGVVHVGLGIFSREVGAGYRLVNLFFGLLLVASGVYALKNLIAASVVSAFIVAVLIGVSWIIEGVMTLVAAGRGAVSKWAFLTGFISIVAGIVVLVLPITSMVLIIVITGIFLIITGIGAILQAFTLGKTATAVQADA